MSSKVAGSIRRGLNQALAYAKHEAREADYRVHVPAEIDVHAIREKLGLTQAQFAARFAASPAHGEQPLAARTSPPQARRPTVGP